MTEEKKIRLKVFLKTLGFDALRAIIAYAVFMFVSSVTGNLFAFTGLGLAKKIHLPSRYVYLFAFVTLIFSLYSVFRAFELYDGEAQEAFGKYERRKYKLFDGLKIAFTDPVLLRKLLVHSFTCFLLTAVLPYGIGFGSVIKALFGEAEIKQELVKLTVMGIGAILYFIVIPLGKTSAHKWWVIAGESEREKILTHPHKRIRLALECVKIFAVYSAGFYIMPAMIMLFVSLFMTLKLIDNPWIWITLVILVLILAFFRRASALNSRARFLRKLKRELKNSGFAYTGGRNALFSVLFPHNEADVTFEKDGRKYAVKLIASVRRGSPTYISPEGIVTSRRTVSFLKFEFFHIMTDRRFDFEADEGVFKLVVFSPMPKRLFLNFGRTDGKPDDATGGFNSYSNFGGADKNGVGRRFRGPGYVSDIERGIIKYFENGERLGEYKVFNPDGILSAISTDCIER